MQTFPENCDGPRNHHEYHRETSPFHTYETPLNHFLKYGEAKDQTEPFHNGCGTQYISMDTL